jgi:hypothetical protein
MMFDQYFHVSKGSESVVFVYIVNGANHQAGFHNLSKELVVGKAFGPSADPDDYEVEWSYGTGSGKMQTRGESIPPAQGLAFTVSIGPSPAPLGPSSAPPSGQPPPVARPVAKASSNSGGIPTTVDEAWAVFGIKAKRGKRDVVKKIYRRLMAEWHPDKHVGKDEERAKRESLRANEAWKLLARHCRW